MSINIYLAPDGITKSWQWKGEDSTTYASYTDPKAEFGSKSSNHLVHTTNIN